LASFPKGPMPPQANLCSLIVALKYQVHVLKEDDAASKTDVCEAVDARISHIVKQLLCAPYCSNFSFEIDQPPEVDLFDRAALHQLEMSDE
jgi:hypothetical protein